MFRQRLKRKENERQQHKPRDQQGIVLKTESEIKILREANQMVAEAFALLKDAIEPGVQLRELDQIVANYIRRQKAKPLYKGYRGNPPKQPPFPGVICASINEQICHGLPDERRLAEGDIIGIDIGLRYRGFCGDACVTFPVGKISEEAQKLLDVSEAGLYAGIAAAQSGARLTNIGAAIQACAEAGGFSVVEDWGGHGVGRTLHEPPSVSHVGPKGKGPRLRPGMVFTIEPMINQGSKETELQADKWTVNTVDGKLSAQFEHTILITSSGPEILSKLGDGTIVKP